MTWWQSLMVDVGGTVITVVIGAAVTWLAHRKGWLARPLKALGTFLHTNAPTLTKDAEALIKKLIQAELAHKAK